MKPIRAYLLQITISAVLGAVLSFLVNYAISVVMEKIHQRKRRKRVIGFAPQSDKKNWPPWRNWSTQGT